MVKRLCNYILKIQSPCEKIDLTNGKEFKSEFALHESIVVGVVDNTAPEGVFTAQTLYRIKAVAEEIAKIDGVAAYDIISPATTDDIEGRCGVLPRCQSVLPMHMVDKQFSRCIIK